MTAEIISMRDYRATHVRASCDHISLAEEACHRWLRWYAATWRDWLRAVWGA
jgi:hypothetical protein